MAISLLLLVARKHHFELIETDELHKIHDLGLELWACGLGLGFADNIVNCTLLKSWQEIITFRETLFHFVLLMSSQPFILKEF